MAVDKDIATRLGDDVGDFVNKWIAANHAGPVPANEILSMLMTHAARLIQLAPDMGHRAHLIGEAVSVLVEISEAPVAVSVFMCSPETQDDMLRAAEPAGRA